MSRAWYTPAGIVSRIAAKMAIKAAKKRPTLAQPRDLARLGFYVLLYGMMDIFGVSQSFSLLRPIVVAVIKQKFEQSRRKNARAKTEKKVSDMPAMPKGN